MANVIILSLLFLTSCFNKEAKISSKQSEYTHTEVLQNRCMSCHKDYLKYGEDEWIKTGLIVPGVPERSPLMRSLRGFQHGNKRNMPPEPNPQLTPIEIETLYNWIASLERVPKGEKNIAVNLDLTKYKAKNELSNFSLYQRCFEQLTNHPITKKVENKKCQNVLDILLSNKNKHYIDVLRIFNSLHNNWFRGYNFHTNNENWGTYEFLDVNTPGLYFTDILLNQKKINDIFNSRYSPKAERDNSKQEYLIFRPNENIKLSTKRRRFYVGNNPDKPVQWNPTPETISVGQLKSISRWKPNQTKVVEFYKNDLERDPIKGNFDFHKGLGGGLLGDKTYLTLNFGHSPGTIMDGQRKVMRSWSKAVFNDLLCRNLPVIDGEDSISFIQESSKISFQRNQSCMRCHASIDNLAGVSRNFTTGLNNLIAQSPTHENDDPIALQTTVPVNTNNIWNKQILTKYVQSPSRGIFYYRDNKGKLHNIRLENIDKLGEYLLSLDDFYECTTSRYITFLTGHKIDVSKLYFTSEDPTQSYLRKLVITESRKLKSHQNIMTFLKNILDSEIYKDKNFEVNF